jgi:hypothetical protein
LTGSTLAKPASALQTRIIRGDQMTGGVRPLPISLIQDPNGLAEQSTLPLQQLYSGGVINPMRMSGVLTLPAFRFPVAPNMRTLASRYFIRLLCGDPSIMPANPTNLAVVHAQDALNPVLTQHVQPLCLTCHVNLDPLAQALSPNFGQYVQTVNDGNSAFGEMMTYNGGAPGYQWGPVPTPGPKTPGGAFLGYPAEGVEQVGQILAGRYPGQDEGTREMFPRCVVKTMFEHVLGRLETFSDASYIEQETKTFMANPNFNELIQDLVDSDAFKRRD